VTGEPAIPKHCAAECTDRKDSTMPDLMQHVCAMHPELAVCPPVVPAPGLDHLLDQAYYHLIIWLGGRGPATFWSGACCAAGCCVVLPLLRRWTEHTGPTGRA
jgi:hypothetical protein